MAQDSLFVIGSTGLFIFEGPKSIIQQQDAYFELIAATGRKQIFNYTETVFVVDIF